MNYADPVLLLAGYSAAITAASLLGVWLSSVFQMTHTGTQGVMSFVAGLILGVALYHLLPHGMAQIPGEYAIETAVWWMMLGIVLMTLLLRLFQFHQHDFSPADAHTRDYHQPGNAAAHSLSWFGIALGMGLHTLLEGVALSVSIQADAGASGILSLSVFLAILLHKPLDALSVASTMQSAGFSRRLRILANVLFALLCPVAAFLAFHGVKLLGQWEGYVVGCALNFAAGAFLCISLSDLLPEAHFHRHDRIKLALCFLSGVGLAYLLRHIEPGALHG